MAKKSKSAKILKKVGHELKTNPPRVLAKTAKKKGAAQAEKQRKAILLNKARKAGASISAPTRDQVISRIKERGANA